MSDQENNNPNENLDNPEDMGLREFEHEKGKMNSTSSDADSDDITKESGASSTAVPVETTPKTNESKPQEKQTYQPVKGFKLGLSEQKSVSDLGLLDLLYYRNLYASLILLLSGTLFFLMITKYEYSVTTFVGRLVLFQVLAFFLYIVGSRIVRNTSGSPNIPLTNLTITEERVTQMVGCIVETINKLIRAYVDILLVKSPKRTVLFAISVQFICLLGKYIAGHVLLYIAFIGAFTLPKIYEFKQEEIDKFYGIAKSKVCELTQIAWQKVPPSVKEYIQIAKTKIEEVTSERPVISTERKNE